MTPKEKIREDFKRALLQVTKALSAQDDVEVSFGGDHATVTGKRARIPLPARSLDPETAAVTRGESDHAALHLAHHDEAAHARLAPKGAEAQAVFRALENARIEAIGATALKGVGDNLAAALEKTISAKGYQGLNAKEVAPLADVAALLLRERLTGRPAPKSAKEIMEACSEDVERLAGASLDALANAEDLDDQEAFAELARLVIRDLDLDDDAHGDQKDEQNPDGDDDPDENQDASDDSEDGVADMPEDGAQDDSDAAEGETEFSEQDFDQMSDDADGAAENAKVSSIRARMEGDSGEAYKTYTTAFDETVDAAELCDEEELGRLRRTLDRQLENMHTIVSRLANKLQRKLLAQQNRSWDFDLDEGVLDAARLARVVVDPMQPLSFKQGAGTGIPRYSCDVAN